MRLAVLTPVGPGHEKYAARALSSAVEAWRYNRGPFTEFRYFFLDDTEATHGRALARNILMEQAYKGWNADWVIHLDSNDMIHTRGFEALEHAMHHHPGMGSYWGCHSMLILEEWAVPSSRPGTRIYRDPRWPGICHLYRTRFDISPLTWDTFLEKKVTGTLGTLACIRADLCYKVGFLPELPAAEFFEHTHAVLSMAPFWKMNRPLVICDRVTPGASEATNDPLADHNPRLNAALAAVNETWKIRGRTPLTYYELESRNRSRFLRRQDFEDEVTVHDDWSEMMVTKNPLDGKIIH